MSQLKKHPDLGGDPEEAKNINEAYDTLRDPIKRAYYDERLNNDRAKGMATSRVEWVEDDERRRVPRRYVDSSVNICVGHDHRWFKGKTVDVSMLGMRVQSEKPLRVGQTVTIAGQNTTTQAIEGKIRWARMFHPSIFERIYEFGVEFTQPVEDIDQRLEI
jgi:DnaJ-class molecular chaperone